MVKEVHHGEDLHEDSMKPSGLKAVRLAEDARPSKAVSPRHMQAWPAPAASHRGELPPVAPARIAEIHVVLAFVEVEQVAPPA